MGSTIHYMRTSPPALLPIFRSASQAHILSEIHHANSPQTLLEISRSAGVPYATVHREVKRMVDAGILLEDRIGNAIVARFNPDSPLTTPLRQLIEIALGPVPVLKELLLGIDGVSSAYIFGSWAERATGITGPPPSDIDIIIIGNPAVSAIYGACRAAGLRLHQDVNPIIMSKSDWREDTVFNKSLKSHRLVTIVGDMVANL
jgi:hypothetical protein